MNMLKTTIIVYKRILLIDGYKPKFWKLIFANMLIISIYMLYKYYLESLVHNKLYLIPFIHLPLLINAF